MTTTKYTQRFDITDSGFGCEVCSLSDGYSVWLQGDEAFALLEELDQAFDYFDAGRTRWTCWEEAQDMILDAYSDLMEVVA
jgi:hypothetical protein